jgi:hypothetical protein
MPSIGEIWFESMPKTIVVGLGGDDIGNGVYSGVSTKLSGRDDSDVDIKDWAVKDIAVGMYSAGIRVGFPQSFGIKALG